MQTLKFKCIKCTSTSHVFFGDKIYLMIGQEKICGPLDAQGGGTISLENLAPIRYCESVTAHLFSKGRGFFESDVLIGSIKVTTEQTKSGEKNVSLTKGRANYSVVFQVSDTFGICTTEIKNLSQLTPSGQGQIVHGLLGASYANQLWDISTLRVKFLNGDPGIQRKIKEIVPIWSIHCGIRFEFSDDIGSEIRINIDSSGRSSSFMGKEARHPSLIGKATMNFGWFKSYSEPGDEDYHATVLHEFGHALGLIHEHQQPNSPIRWNKENVYAKLGAITPEQKLKVDLDWINTYDKTQSNAGEYDIKSIMHYQIPSEFIIGQGPEIPYNYQLSEMDKKFISQLYPRNPDSPFSIGRVRWECLPGRLFLE
jgi:hypothetical protein